MGVGQQIGQAAGSQAEEFSPLIIPIPANGDLYTVHAVCGPGTALSFQAAGSAQPVPINQDGRSVLYLGFNAQDVITSTQYPIELQFGYRSVVDVDLVAIYQVGRFRVPSSDASSTITAGALVYPSKNTAGLLADAANAATDGSHACPAFGWCSEAPAAAGGAMTVEIMLFGGRSVIS